MDEVLACGDRFRRRRGVFILGFLLLIPGMYPHRLLWIALPAIGLAYVIVRLELVGPVYEEKPVKVPSVPPNRSTTETDQDKREVDYDLPITVWSGDKIGRGPFVLSIAEEILDRRAACYRH
jgi:hypothetical protein